MAGIFNQAKDLIKLQREAKAMQKKMKQIKVYGLSDDELIKVTMDATQEIEEIEIADELVNVDSKRELIRGLKQAYKDAQKKIQKEMVKDMDMDKLKGMLG